MNYMEKEGVVRVPLPADEAMALFTPEGERRWVPGWDPTYPAGDPSLDPGTVFETRHDGRTTTWVVVDRDDHAVRYARLTPGVQAGTVSVRCHGHAGGTVAHVVYRLTPLAPEAADELRGFADGFHDVMREWERRIGEALALA